MERLHSLLKRQLKKHLAGHEAIPPEWQPLINAVNEAYNQSDEDRKMLERSMELSSQELLQANAQMRVIFQGIPDHLFLVDDNGIIRDYKIGMENFLALKPEHLIGKHINETPMAEFADILENTLNDVLISRKIETLEFIKWVDGKEFFLEVRLTPVTDRMVIYIIRNITAEKTAELALRMSEVKYRTQFEIATDAIFIVKSNTFYDCNSKTLSMFGCNRDQIVGQTPFVFSPVTQPDGRSSVEAGLELLEKAMAGEPQFFEWKHCRLDRSLFDAEVSLKRFDIKNDIFIMAMVRDITVRKQAQGELAKEKERLSVTLESINDGVISTNVDGIIILMNRVAEEITGWNTAVAQGKQLKHILTIQDEATGIPIENLLFDIIPDGKAVEVKNHLILITPDGAKKDIAISGSPLRDDKQGIIGMVLVIKDITESKKIEEEMLRARKLESVGVLAGGIAHDFNNILTGILGNITLAKMMDEKAKPVTDKLLNAEKAALRARELTRQFLTFSRGGAPIKQTASIVQLLEDSIQLLLRDSNVKSEFLLPPDLWPVDIDKSQIHQVINNMITNANQAMPDGGTVRINGNNVLFHAPMQLPLEPGRYIKLSITDSGIGIAPEHLKKIFDPYFTTKTRGSGLGLASSYAIIRKHGGIILVNSSPGNGTTFDIYLPASQNPLTKEVSDNNVKRCRGRIILMDDEEVIRQSTAEQLQLLGYDVATAQNGEELIEMYTDAEEIGETFDLLILDLTVPGGMGGEKTMTVLLEINPNVRAIVSSGYSDKPIMADYKTYGFCGVVTKPYKIEELDKEVQRVLKLDIT